MLLQQQHRSSGIQGKNAYDLERKKNAWCKITLIVGWEVADCYKTGVLRFRIEWYQGKVDGCD